MKKPRAYKMTTTQWFVANHDKTNKWIAVEDTGQYTCANHPLIKQGYTIYGSCAFKDPKAAIEYVRPFKEGGGVYVARRVH
jgi:hypothetical protein